MYAMDYIPPVVNNEKLVVKHPFKYNLIDKEGVLQEGVIPASSESKGIRSLKFLFRGSTKHKLTAVPGNWINSVKRMGSAV